MEHVSTGPALPNTSAYCNTAASWMKKIANSQSRANTFQIRATWSFHHEDAKTRRAAEAYMIFVPSCLRGYLKGIESRACFTQSLASFTDILALRALADERWVFLRSQAPSPPFYTF